MAKRVPAGVQIEWFGPHAMMAIRNAGRKAIHKLALQTEAHAKVNIQTPFEHADGDVRGQIDTGAMMNTTRAVLDGLPQGVEAAVISSQHYAPYQEAIRAFLWPAAQQGMQDFPSMVGEAKREFGS